MTITVSRIASVLLAAVVITVTQASAQEQKTLPPGQYSFVVGAKQKVPQNGPVQLKVQRSPNVVYRTPAITKQDIDDAVGKLSRDLSQKINGPGGLAAGIDAIGYKIEDAKKSILGSVSWFGIFSIAATVTMGLLLIGFGIFGARWIVKRVATVDREETNRFVSAISDLSSVVSGLRGEMVTKLAALRRQEGSPQPTAEELAERERKTGLIKERDGKIAQHHLSEIEVTGLKIKLRKVVTLADDAGLVDAESVVEVAGDLRRAQANFKRLKAEIADINCQLGEQPGEAQKGPGVDLGALSADINRTPPHPHHED